MKLLENKRVFSLDFNLIKNSKKNPAIKDGILSCLFVEFIFCCLYQYQILPKVIARQ